MNMQHWVAVEHQHIIKVKTKAHKTHGSNQLSSRGHRAKRHGAPIYKIHSALTTLSLREHDVTTLWRHLPEMLASLRDVGATALGVIVRERLHDEFTLGALHEVQNFFCERFDGDFVLVADVAWANDLILAH